MTNRYYNNTTSFFPGTTAKGDEVDDKFDGVTAGFDTVQGEVNDAIRLTNADITTAQVIADAASSRANKVIGFDASGNLALKVAGADWRGNWTTGTYYRQNDIVKDSAGTISLNSLFICLTTHTAGATLLADSSNWALMVDVASVVVAQEAAEDAQAAAEAAQSGAENARDDADAILDSFDDRYLGAKATNPSVDNDNNALITGALYWNTTVGEMRVWSGSVWVTAYVPTGAYLPLTGGGMSGDIDLNNYSVLGLKLAGFEGEYDAGDSGSSKTISFSNGAKQKLRLTAPVTSGDGLTLSFSGCPVGIYQLRLYNNGTGGYAVTWTGIASTDWIGSGTAPSINGDPDGSTIVNFFYNGTKPFGAVSRVGMA